MQAFGVLSFLACIASMYGIYMEWALVSELFFALSLIFFAVSLLLSLIEIQRSTHALELQLGDMEDGENSSILSMLKKKRDSLKK
ncbi:DUF2721 domain-containing protein [Olivibacter sitiensis]|uniref:DUF2721 domain-containing protein n=1 Tax=Olivibacter sitiensis TaxID=376470 RepID=UPI0004291448|nr:DUF2721 domain-containing protein [Olivibacter sitiensis]